MNDFLNTYNSLNLPKSEDDYEVDNSNLEKIIVGKNYRDRPVILIQAEQEGELIEKELKHINIRYNIDCTVHNKTNEFKTSKFTIIELNEKGTENLIEHFLRVSESIIANLPENPSVKDFQKIFKELIDMFDTLGKAPQKTTQGLWTEILFIALSKHPDFFIETWHSVKTQIYDFSYQNEKIEVKSTQHDKREHFFSLDQLYPSENLNLVLVSYIVNKSDNYGKSINDLFRELETRISIENKNKLYKMIATTLGDNVYKAIDMKFDFKAARDSVTYFDWAVIQKIDKNDIPAEVKIKGYTSLLGGQETLSQDQVRKMGHIFSKI